MKKNLSLAKSNTLRNTVRNVGAFYASAAMACMSTVLAVAGEGVFNGMQTSLLNVINSAQTMLYSFVIPLAVVAALCSILIMYLPGMSNKTTDKCKSVLWACVATVAIAYALKGIFAIAQNVGNTISG